MLSPIAMAKVSGGSPRNAWRAITSGPVVAPPASRRRRRRVTVACSALSAGGPAAEVAIEG